MRDRAFEGLTGHKAVLGQVDRHRDELGDVTHDVSFYF
jgi:hypothetical protein